jgi:hypothetical protein
MLDGDLSDIERLERREVNDDGRVYIGRDMSGVEVTVIAFARDTDDEEDTDE